MTGPGRALRVDARRNQERILVAARAALTEVGLDVGVDEIARRAGVGVGTIYRRFGDREALVHQVLLDAVETLAAATGRTRGSGGVGDLGGTGGAGSGDTEDAVGALRRFADEAVAIRLGVLATVLMPVMAGAVGEDADGPADSVRVAGARSVVGSRSVADTGADAEFRRAREALLAGVEEMLRAARWSGELRGGIGAADFLLSLAKATRPLPGVPADVDAALTRRAVAVLLDGMVAVNPGPLPGGLGDRRVLDSALGGKSGGDPDGPPGGASVGHPTG